MLDVVCHKLNGLPECIYIYTFIYIYMPACIYVYTQHVYMYIHTYTHIYKSVVGLYMDTIADLNKYL